MPDDDNAGSVGAEEAQRSEEDIREEEEMNGTRKPRIARVPKTPTRAAIDEHYPLHMEYR